MTTSLAKTAVQMMKARMKELNATPGTVQAAVLPTLTNDVMMALPKRQTLNRILQNTRQQSQTTSGLPPVPRDCFFVIPQLFAEFVLYDSGPGENRIILLGCNELLDGLARADVWLADGTFKVVPDIFFQLYSIHFNFMNGFNPAALYCIVSDKTTETYGKILQQLALLIPDAAPRVILVDYERAAINSFRNAYQNPTVSGCYFHLCQSINRKVNELGLKTVYESNNDFRIYVRCFPALAFVPPGDVIDAFDILSETKPDGLQEETIDQLNLFIDFFEHTYVRGRRLRGKGENYGQLVFSIDLWNKHASSLDGIARSTNAVEGWHHGLQSLY